MAHDEVSGIPGAEGWSYGAFQPNQERGSLTIPLHRDDGKDAEFTVPDFVTDPEDLRAIAAIVTAALEKWQQVKGLGG